MDPQTEAVLQANDQFYRALSLADLSAMERVWVESADAVCVHPGWVPVHGWDAIRDSWRNIFEHQGPLRVWATEAEVRVFGQTAEVRCLENIDTGQIAGAGILQTRATNLFRRVAAEWKLLEHHAAPTRAGGQRLEPFSSN
jgi:ketosteroid isomerase-like protein